MSVGVPGTGTSLQTTMQWLMGLLGTPGQNIPAGSSDELAQAYLQAISQGNIAALNQAAQLSSQDVANQIRMTELMGAAAGGTPTDAANRWRQELQAQQAVQNERLRLDAMNALGYNPNNPNQTTLDKEKADREWRRQYAEMMGYEYDPITGQSGRPTLAATAQQAEIDRRAAELYGQGSGGETLDKQRMRQDAEQAEKERQLRLQLQSGQLSQQEAEFARTYLLQQDANRRAQAELTGRTETGDLTEAARATREQERQANARNVADLTANSRDIFKAGRYFRQMQDDPTGTGMSTGDSGMLGFTTGMQRAEGVPGTLSMDDAALATGGAGASGISALAAPPTDFSAMLGGSSATPSAPSAPSVPSAPQFSMGASGTTPRQQIEEEASGMSPGGPVGMGAGGSFIGREQPKITREQVEDPRTQAFFREIKGMLKGEKRLDESRKQRKRAKPGAQPSGSVRMPMTFEGRQERDHRGVRGLIELAKRTDGAGQPYRGNRGAMDVHALLKPGMQPGGPVAAPLWPTTGGTTQPSIQTPQSLGISSASTYQTMSAPAAPAASGLPSYADTDMLDSKVAATSEFLRRNGIQGMGAQNLERMSSTQRGIWEGALEALGLDVKDAEQAYAQTRWANIGNALSA